METIKKKGTINSISYRSVENWSVFSVGGMTCTGILPSMVDVGHEILCEGIWVDSKYGKQLKCSSVAPAEVDTNSENGVAQLLTLLPGIGKIKAKNAVKELGPELAWKAAQECPSYLGVSTVEKSLDVKGKALGLIGEYKATTYLLGIGLTENQTNKVIKKYGVDGAINQVRTEPYQLINDISGFGFRIVDGIALKAGLKSDCDQRVLACILFCLDDNEKNNGNVWFYGGKLVKIVIEELMESAMSQGKPVVTVEYSTVKKLIHQLAKAGRVFVDGKKVYSAELLRAEKVIYEAMGG